MGFPERLKQLRKEKNIHQSELGDLLELSQNSISQYERGTRTPDINQLKRLAGIFGVTSDYLLGLSELREPTDENLVRTVKELFADLEEVRRTYKDILPGEVVPESAQVDRKLTPLEELQDPINKALNKKEAPDLSDIKVEGV